MMGGMEQNTVYIHPDEFYHDGEIDQMVKDGFRVIFIPACPICDGVGHGQPGWGPCPLEDQRAYDPALDWEWF
jgi:hypothetical protein